MPKRTLATVWLLIALLVVYSPLVAQPDNKAPSGEKGKQPSAQTETKMGKQRPSPYQDKGPNFTEAKVLSTLDWLLAKGDNSGTAEAMCIYLYNLAESVESFKSQEVAKKIIDLPEFESLKGTNPQKVYDLTLAKFAVLSQMPEYPGARNFAIDNLNHESSRVQVKAAATLLSCGEWDLAAPIICKNEAYIEFQQHKDDRAIPLLEQAVNTGSWRGRIFAAAALFYSYGDSTQYPRVALDIILNAPINTNEVNTNTAKFLALHQVSRFNLTNALPGLVRMAEDTARGIGPKAVGLLVDLSGMGYSEAHQALVDIEKNHANANIREIARHGLTRLEQNQK